MGKKLFGLVIVAAVILAFIGPRINNNYTNKQGDLNVASQAEAATIEKSVVPKVNSGISVTSAQKYVGYIVTVNKAELPVGLESFTKMAVSISPFPFYVENKGISKDILDNAYVCPNNTYAALEDAGTWYVLVVLCNDNKEALGYYEAVVKITAPDPIKVPEASKGVKVKSYEKIHGIKITVNKNKLQADMAGFKKMAISISTKPFNVSDKGLPNNITMSANAYPGNKYFTAVQTAGTWYVLTVLCDDNNHALGYYETFIKIPYVPKVKVPVITSGITVENSLTYTGYEIILSRSSLPEWAQGYSKIGIATSFMKPINVPTEGLPFNLNAIMSYDESSDGVTRIGSVTAAMKWYVVIALFDEYNNQIGYLDTSIDVEEKQSLPIDQTK